MSFKGRTGVKSGQINQFRSSLPQADSIYQPIYDYQVYPTAGATVMNFFQLPQGQGTTSSPGATGTKTAADAYLQTAGMLPLGNRFLCLGIEVEFWPGSNPGLALTAVPTEAQTARNWDDVYAVMKSGVLTFNIQNRVFAQDAPLMKFPTQTRLAGVATNALQNTNATVVNYQQIEYAATVGAAYDIVPVYIESTQGFNVQVAWPAAVATPSGVDGRIGVRLIGKLVRNAQ